MQMFKAFAIVALLTITTHKSMAEITFENGDEKLADMYSTSTLILAEDLKIGEIGFTAYLNLKVCSGKIVTFSKLEIDEEKYLKDTSKWRAKGWWKVKRLTSETLELNYIPREFKRANLEDAFNDLNLTYLTPFGSVADVCAVEANKLRRRELLSDGRRVFLNKIDNIGGKKSLREFYKSMDFMIEQMKASNN